jgi:hypothetical protein
MTTPNPKLSIWTKAAVAVGLAIASMYGFKKPIQDAVCSSYHFEEGYTAE